MKSTHLSKARLTRIISGYWTGVSGGLTEWEMENAIVMLDRIAAWLRARLDLARKIRKD